MIPDPPPPFDLDMSHNLREHIRQLSRRAVVAGIGQEFRDAVSDILEQLYSRPRE